METKFYLRKEKGKKESFIYFSLKNVDGEDYRFSTKEKIEVKNWDRGYPKRIAATMTVRNIIDGYKTVIDDYIKDNIKKKKRQPTKEEFLIFIDVLLNGEPNKHNKSIDDYVDEFLADPSLGIAASTKRVKRIHLDHFLNFIGKKNKLTDINQFKLIKYDEFIKGEKGRQLVTVNNYKKNLIAFLNWLQKKQYVNIELSKYLKKDKEIEKDVIALTNAEYIKLEQAVFENQSYQEQIDIFLISCYTSLSISDLKKMDEEDVFTNDITKVRRSKNANYQRFLLIPQALNLLEKYNYKLPFICDNKGCEILKKAFKELKMNRKVKITYQTLYGIVNEEYKKLYEVVSWHKGRKTAITTLLQNGVPSQIVMEISGHKKESTLNRYKAVESKFIQETMFNVRPQ